MSDKLEAFVKNNKKQFEEKTPSDQLWAKIAAELDKKKQQRRIKLYKWMNLAAILVIVLGIYSFYRYREINKPLEVADISTSYGKKAVRYASLIEEKRDSLQVYKEANPDLYNKFTTDMEKLNRDYKELQKQLQTSPNREIVVRAMVKNLEIQSRVLSEQLKVINQINQYKKENTI